MLIISCYRGFLSLIITSIVKTIQVNGAFRPPKGENHNDKLKKRRKTIDETRSRLDLCNFQFTNLRLLPLRPTFYPQRCLYRHFDFR